MPGTLLFCLYENFMIPEELILATGPISLNRYELQVAILQRYQADLDISIVIPDKSVIK